MVTYVYICKKCHGDDEDLAFEHTFTDIETAHAAEMPVCPVCGSNAHVVRFFRHKIYGPAKSAVRDHAGDHANRFVELEPRHGRGIVSVGIRVDAEDLKDIEEHIRESVENTGLEIIDRSDEQTARPDADLTEELLGLKRGSVERALFDVRQKKMIDELREGASISGFFLPLSGEYSN